MATSIYAPLGTAMSLSNYDRVTKTFLEFFKAAHLPDPAPSGDLAGQEVGGQLKKDLKVSQHLAVHYTISLI